MAAQKKGKDLLCQARRMARPRPRWRVEVRGKIAFSRERVECEPDSERRGAWRELLAGGGDAPGARPPPPEVRRFSRAHVVGTP